MPITSRPPATRRAARLPPIAAPTFGAELPAAELCRRNGWGVGTQITATDDLDGRIERIVLAITAVGEAELLARRLISRGKERQRWSAEYQPVLCLREWRPLLVTSWLRAPQWDRSTARGDLFTGCAWFDPATSEIRYTDSEERPQAAPYSSRPTAARPGGDA